MLSIPSKVFCRVILNRVRIVGSGFRAGRGFSAKNFAVRNIVEQCIDCNAHLFVNFVDFRKAFVSIHRDNIWAIMKHTGLHQKIVSLIKMFYERFGCGVILKENDSDFLMVLGMHSSSDSR